MMKAKAMCPRCGCDNINEIEIKKKNKIKGRKLVCVGCRHEWPSFVLGRQHD